MHCKRTTPPLNGSSAQSGCAATLLSAGAFADFEETTPMSSAIPAASQSAAARDSRSLRGAWNCVAAWLERWIVHDALALIIRVAIAAVFWLSGRTKVDGLLTVNQTAFDLFRSEYKLPLVPPEIAAYMATYAETFFPILLVLGLFTRFAALSLLMIVHVAL